MAQIHTRRSRRAGRGRALCLGASLALVGAGPLWFGGAPAFSMNSAGGGMSRSQQRSQQHTRANLPGTVEVPREVPPPPEEPAPEMPERRVPYSMNVVSHFPGNKHLHEESNARKMIEAKFIHALDNVEDLIRHVEVNLQVTENFKREKPINHKVQLSDIDGALDAVAEAEPSSGSKQITPYLFKVAVTLANQRSIAITNAEKHSQATITEALDHVVDVLRKSLREEKDKMIDARRRAKANAEIGADVLPDANDYDEAYSLEPTEEDLQAERMYEEIEKRTGKA